jgi:hypothetical protein
MDGCAMNPMKEKEGNGYLRLLWSLPRLAEINFNRIRVCFLAALAKWAS